MSGVVKSIIDTLERTPEILTALLDEIPSKNYPIRRLIDKWSLAEQLAHLVEAQNIIYERFLIFEKEDTPFISSYNPPKKEQIAAKIEIYEELEKFSQSRNKLVCLLRGFPSEYWEKVGQHELYEPYNTRLLLSHTLHVDYVHLFSMEQLGLTKDGLEKEILTLP